MAKQTAANNLEHAEKMAAHWLYLANMAAERGDYELEKRHLAREQKWHDIMNNLLGLGEDEPTPAPAATMLKDFDDAQPEAPATSGAASLLKDFDASETTPEAAEVLCEYCHKNPIWEQESNFFCQQCIIDHEGELEVATYDGEIITRSTGTTELDALRAENEALKQQLAAARAALEAISYTPVNDKQQDIMLLTVLELEKYTEPSENATRGLRLISGWLDFYRNQAKKALDALNK